MRQHRGTQWRKAEENLFSDTVVLLLANSPTVCLWKSVPFNQNLASHDYTTEKPQQYNDDTTKMKWKTLNSMAVPPESHDYTTEKQPKSMIEHVGCCWWCFEVLKYIFSLDRNKKPPNREAFLFGELPDLKDQHWDQMLLGLISFPRCEKTDLAGSAFSEYSQDLNHQWSPSMIDHIK